MTARTCYNARLGPGHEGSVKYREGQGARKSPIACTDGDSLFISRLRRGSGIPHPVFAMPLEQFSLQWLESGLSAP